MDTKLLPIGKHWGLEISHMFVESGRFIAATPKMVWHTTEGSNLSGAVSTLTGNGDEPHCIIDMSASKVIQFIPFDEFSKSLEHPPGTPETNRAHCIQIEIVGFAAQSGNWSNDDYLKLGSLAMLIKHRVNVAAHSPIPFGGPEYRRVPENVFPSMGGHFGHRHVPNNSHTDPGPDFNVNLLFDMMIKAEKLYA